MYYYTLQVLVTSFSCISVLYSDFSAWGGREPGGSGKGRVHRSKETQLPFGNGWPLILYLFLPYWPNNDTTLKEWEVKKNTVFSKLSELYTIGESHWVVMSNLTSPNNFYIYSALFAFIFIQRDYLFLFYYYYFSFSVNVPVMYSKAGLLQ